MQSLNYYVHCVNTHNTAVISAWSTVAVAQTRIKRHEWVRWANREHGMLLYPYKRQAEQWLREAEVMLIKKKAQASK